MKRDTHRGPVPGLSKRTHAIRHTFRLLLELYAAPRSCLSHHPALFNTIGHVDLVVFFCSRNARILNRNALSRIKPVESDWSKTSSASKVANS